MYPPVYCTNSLPHLSTVMLMLKSSFPISRENHEILGTLPAFLGGALGEVTGYVQLNELESVVWRFAVCGRNGTLFCPRRPFPTLTVIPMQVKYCIICTNE